MNRITRRELLKGATGIGAIAVSGCVAQPEDASGESPDPTDPEPTSGDGDEPTTDLEDSNDATTDPSDSDNGTTAPGDSRADASAENVADAAGIDDASIETIEARCGSPDEDSITVETNAETVIIDGVLPASNHCHEAVLTAGSVDDGTLSLVVDVAETTTDGGGCVMCHGTVSYRAELELGDPSAVESVAVDHETGDRHAADLDWADADVEAPIESASIETVDASCASGDTENVAVDFGEEAITVTGTLPAPNPCHEAVLGPIDLDDDQLSVVVDVSSTLEEGEICVECVGAISYEAVIEPTDPSAITEVAVDHRTGAESRVMRSSRD